MWIIYLLLVILLLFFEEEFYNFDGKFNYVWIKLTERCVYLTLVFLYFSMYTYLTVYCVTFSSINYKTSCYASHILYILRNNMKDYEKLHWQIDQTIFQHTTVIVVLVDYFVFFKMVIKWSCCYRNNRILRMLCAKRAKSKFETPCSASSFISIGKKKIISL